MKSNAETKRYKKKSILASQAGFTMIEIIAVVTIISVLAAIIASSMISFIEHGKQINRMNIARTLYLATQNQLTKSKVEGNLKSKLSGDYYNKGADGVYSAKPNKDKYDDKNVAKELGKANFPDKDNSSFIHYISKPKGYEVTDDDTELNRFYKLLDEIIIDKSILDGAILLEYNIETGVVLSIFYSDVLDDKQEFDYLKDASEVEEKNNVMGKRGMDDAYQYASKRKQGYYGVTSTGELAESVLKDKDIVNIYDTATSSGAFATDFDDKINVLYAEFFLAPSNADGTMSSYTFEIVNAKTSERLKSIDVDLNDKSLPLSFDQAFSANATAIVYCDDTSIQIDENGINIAGAYNRYIWIVDYIDGDILSSQPHSAWAGIEPSIAPQNIRARATRDGGTSVTSRTIAHSHFASEMSNNKFELKSARHLNNIRYAPMNSNYRQTSDISMAHAGNKITNFAPIEGLNGESFSGEYYAMMDSASQYRIENLIIDTTSDENASKFSNVGLFSNVSGKLQGVSLFKSTIRAAGENNINVGAIAGTMSGGFIKQSNSYANLDVEVNGAGANVGGLVGCISAGTLEQSFNAGFYNTHEIDPDIIGFGSVNATGGNIGGLVGLNYGIIQNSFNNGRVNVESAELSSDSLKLSIEPSYFGVFHPVSLGGIAGNNSGTIKNTYATNYIGIYMGGTNASTGGIAGTSSGDVENSFYITNGCDDDKAIALSKEELREAFTKGVYINGAAYEAGENSYTKYPYPTLENNNLIVGAGWEDILAVDAGIAYAELLYYELYNDNTWGHSESTLTTASTIEHSGSEKLVINDGYAIELAYYSAGYKLALADRTFKITTEGTEDWIIKEGSSEPLSWPVSQKEDGIYLLYIPNSIIESCIDEDNTINISIYANANKNHEAVEPIFTKDFNPLFAPADYGLIRSPRHIDNIDKALDSTYNQQLNVDFGLYRKELTYDSASMTFSEAVVSGNFTGSYDGNGKYIANVTIHASAKDNVGLFSTIEGTSENITMVNPSIDGQNNVGSICGTLNGTANNIYISYTNETTNTITGISNTGGVLGINNGTVSNITFISPTADIHVLGKAVEHMSTVGGIVGANNGSVQRGLFLAIAPKNDEIINPIIGSNTALPEKLNKLYYLSGIDIRPGEIQERTYNTVASNNIGTPIATNEIIDEIIYENWSKDTLTETTVLEESNNIYPYPYDVGSRIQIALHPNWPITVSSGEINISDIAYYEIYKDNSYGTWFTKDTGGNGTLKNNKEITEAGYAIILNQNLTATHHFFARPDKGSESWESADKVSIVELENTSAFAVGISAAAGKSGSWVYKLPLEKLYQLEKESAPLQIMHTINANGSSPKQIYGYMQPLFSKGLYVYEATAPDPSEFFIRTPWQMKNISVLTKGIDSTSGKTFKQEIPLDFKNTGAGVNSEYSAVTYSDLIAPIVEDTFNGTYNGNVIKNVIINSTVDDIGLFAKNNGTVQNISLKASAINGGNNVGSIAGQNSAFILKTGVEHSTVSGIGNNIGGITGSNTSTGKVEDVFFLSAANVDTPPVSNNGGGIIGSNNGSVTHALYIAPTPKSKSGTTTTIYPIVRSGNPGEVITNSDGDTYETCYYLSGHRYSLNEGKDWRSEGYNLIGTDPVVKLSGGGKGLITKFLDAEWLNFVYKTSLTNWSQPTSGYPYPVIKGIPTPSRWPEGDSPVRPDQVDRDDWISMLPTSDRALNLGFVNGDFNSPLKYPDGSEKSFYTNTTDGRGWLVTSGEAHVSGTNSDFWVYYNPSYVQGWLTRPVNEANLSNTQWNAIEFQRPNSTAGNGRSRIGYNGLMNTAYAELNAQVEGTLYQICSTTPNQKFYYSFYHLTRTTSTATDRMSFYLTGVSDTALHAGYNNDELTLIRPCWSPRSQPTDYNSGLASNALTFNPTASNTVDYGNTYVGSLRSYWQGKEEFAGCDWSKKPYIYDVWIGSTGSGSNATRTGYGITFWSNTAITGLNTSGYTSITAMPESVRTVAQNNTFGYWGIDYGWKHYYGLYTVPAGQRRTEFAYQSNASGKPHEGNYLAGIRFKSPAFLSVDKFISDKDGNSVSFVKPGDLLSVDLHVKSWGEIPADTIVIKDKLSPFNQYIEYKGNIKVMKGTTEISATSSYEGGTVKIELPPNLKLNTNDELKITFDIKVLDKVLSNNITETLLYYFKNQAVIEYCEDKTANENKFDVYKDTININGSGPDPLQVFIDPIKLGKTVSTSGISGYDPLIDGPFTVTLSIFNSLEEGNSIETRGIINDLIPKGFKLTSSVFRQINGGVQQAVDTVNTVNTDGTTRITIRDVCLDSEIRHLEYTYSLEYVGNGYGVAYVNTSADYKYMYIDKNTVDPLSVLLKFHQPVVGISIKTWPDSFVANENKTHIFDITANDSFAEKLADNNYDVTPEVVLTDSLGREMSKNEDDNYWVNHTSYTAVLAKGSNNLEFTPKSTASGTYEIYYKIKLTARKAGQIPESFDLSSKLTKVTVYVVETDKVLYYEKYEDNSYGFYGGYNISVPQVLSDTKMIVESGYCVLSAKSDKLIQLDGNIVPSNCEAYSTAYLHKINSSTITNFALLKVSSGIAGDMKVLGNIHPNFAKSVYATDAGSTLYIRTPQQMQNISLVDTTGKDFIQERNLDFNSISTLGALGAVVNGEFKGTYDGGGKIITGVKIDSALIDNVGLFSQNSGEIKNMTLQGNRNNPVKIVGNENVGGIAGYNKLNGVIEDCAVEGTDEGLHIESFAGVLLDNTQDGGGEAGGITGLNEGEIIGCTTKNAVESIEATTLKKGDGYASTE